VALTLLARGSQGGDASEGAAIYKSKCAICHGPHGEGTKDYPNALTGDKSVLELQKLINDTMPEGEPEDCVGEEAAKVAAYIHDAFYSIIAQERNRPATIGFSRLTVHQLENSVADLMATFRGNGPWYTEHGLRAEYYNLRSFNNKKRVFDRTDPKVSFNFADKKPEGFPAEPDKEERRKDDIHDDAEFSIRWSGSVLAPETGDYEFIVESENGVRLYVNDQRQPIFDAWVRSGDQNRYSQTVRLLGGRYYSLRLEFFRYKEKTASIKLKWKRPHRIEEVLPERFLAPKGAQEVFVLTTPFPPDDRSLGYERGNAVSKGWQDAITMASLETAGYVVDHLNQLAGIKDGDPEREKKIQTFCQNFVERAFRRPLSDDDKKMFVERPLQGVPTETGIKRLVLLTMMSPQFLYREYGLRKFDSYAAASWLSYTLWDSLPDKALLEAAKKNELRTRDQISRQVDRMLGDYRTRGKLRDFLHQWLRLDRFPEILKDQKLYAGFDQQLVSDLHLSLDLFLDELLSGPEADFRKLLLDDGLYVNERMAKFYGFPVPKEGDFAKVSMGSESRSGVLTHPLLLAGFAYDQQSSPIHRGVFIARSLLGRRLKPPPEAVAPLAPDLHAGLSTRERVLLQTSPASCQTCHSMINDLGFSLEHFDAAGRFRQKEKDRLIDAEGSYLNRDGKEIDFKGSRALAEFLAVSPEVHEAFVEQLFQYTVKQPIRAFGINKKDELRVLFAKNNFNIHKLLREIAISSVMGAEEADQQKSTSQASTVSKGS
jgi:hypothetical protein